MRLLSRVSVLATALLAGIWVGQAGAAPLTPAVQTPVIGGMASFDGALSPDGEIFAEVEGDLSSPPVFDDPTTTLTGGSFFLEAFGTPGVDLEGSFIIDGVGGGFDADLVFLSGMLEDFGYDDTRVTLVFGSLDGQAATVFGSRVLVSFFDFGVPQPEDGIFSGNASYTIQSIATIPLPLTAVLLLSGLAGLALLRARHVAVQA